mgnify:CR=1 FL=1
MEKINSENIISALFLLGFDKVDVLLYMCVLAKLTLDNQNEERFTLEDEDFSFLFCQNIEFNGKVLEIKGNEGLDTTVMVIDGKPYSLRRMLKCNEKFMEQIKKLDFEKIIRRKINIMCEDKVYIYREFFSSKEIDIINKTSNLTLSMKKNKRNCFN